MTQALDQLPVVTQHATPKTDFEQLLDRPVPVRHPSEVLADNLGISREVLIPALRRSVMPRGCSDDDFMAFIQIAAKYTLNPFTREIFAIPKKGGGIQVVVGVDGWVTIVQRNKRYDGVEFHEVEDANGTPSVTTCTMYVKGQGHPVIVAERFRECRRGTDPWQQMPFRMLRHKAYIQAARLAFGINGIADEEEGSVAAGYATVEEALRATGTERVAADPNKEANPFAGIAMDENEDAADAAFADEEIKTDGASGLAEVAGG